MKALRLALCLALVLSLAAQQAAATRALLQGSVSLTPDRPASPQPFASWQLACALAPALHSGTRRPLLLCAVPGQCTATLCWLKLASLTALPDRPLC